MATNKPKLIVIAGPNGSGKTSVTTQILKLSRMEEQVHKQLDFSMTCRKLGLNFIIFVKNGTELAVFEK
jgi:ABC-type Mn2+/Zn2+ transport system ATPase subunit